MLLLWYLLCCICVLMFDVVCSVLVCSPLCAYVCECCVSVCVHSLCSGSETAWGDSGGGFSNYFSRPSWQTQVCMYACVRVA